MMKIVEQNKKNTTKIGTDFENRVFKLFSSLIINDELSFISKKHSKIFQHKQYKCLGLNRIIDFDITIETYNSDTQDDWSSLVVIECKCLTRTVDISDLDEFETKMRKISSSGIKGIMVTTKCFSANSIEQARKAHIALMVLSEEQYNWIVSRNINKSEHQMQILLGNMHPGIVPTIYEDGLFTSLCDSLNNKGISIEQKNITDIPWLEKNQIKEYAQNLHKQCTFSSNNIIEEILKQQYPEYKIIFKKLPDGILGSLSFSNKTISLSNQIISDTHRKNFTLAHELGHLYLHNNFLKSFNYDLVDYEETFVVNLSDEILKRMEFQANFFASYILLPEKKFFHEVFILFNKYSITKNYLYLDHQPCNQREVLLILHALSSKFNVSIEVIKIHMKNEKLLIIEDNEPKRMNNIFTSTKNRSQ